MIICLYVNLREYANEQGSVFLWCKFRDRLSRVNSDCPVCHRCFDSDAERDELLNEVSSIKVYIKHYFAFHFNCPCNYDNEDNV